MHVLHLTVAACLISFTRSIPPSTTSKPAISDKNCGYKSCHPIKKGFLNVHIVPHTHDDVGWLKTVDQYYYGSNTKYQNAGVQYILDTVMDSLRKDKTRRFIYVETAFFWKWWIKQHDIVKSRVRKLVYNGQLEFISGGWSMNDEAVTHYHSIIDQMTWGLRKLNDTFGECGRPKIGWQIDPFGHSREMASIFAQLGFDGVLLGRIDHQEKRFRWQTRTPEMVWRGSDSLGEASDIFTGVMYNTYSPPPGFCFDILCGDEPVIDDKKSFEYNVDRRVDEFVAYLDNVTRVYTTDNVIITMGEDFNYQDAEAWFANLDKLIYYVNQRQQSGSKYNLIYSTPSCYIKAIHNETKHDWLLKRDDFFPYASDPHAFWTGYFTSRPALKRFERVGNNFLQVCKQLYALADLGPEDMIDLNALREAMGVMQHHDAVTGTEKQHVASDYARQLQRGIDECEIITNAAISKLLKTDNIGIQTCPLLNVSQCATTTADLDNGFVVTIYNPLSRPVDKVVRLPVTGDSYSVNDSQGAEYKTQIIPIPDFIKNIPGRVSVAKNDLIFIASGIPALGWKSYRVTVNRKTHKRVAPKKSHKHSVKDTAFIVDPKSGLVNGLTVKNVSIDLRQNFFYYNGFVGDNKNFDNRSSGAYIFRPDGPLKKITTEKVDYKVYQGELVAEIHQTFNEYVSQIIRVNAIDNYVEFDWIIGPLPRNGTKGIEVVTKYQTDFKANSVFYTDSNGKQMLKRIRNFRPSWKLNLSEPVAGNYYPVTSQISIRDENTDHELAVLVDRAQGGTSLEDGQIELMVHRNCLHDDAFGVGEALNETAFGRGLVVRGSHYVTVGSTDNGMAALTKDIAQRRLLDTWTFVAPVANKGEFKHGMEFAGLKRPLPESVQILTLEPWTGFDFLLRLEHVFEKGRPVVVPLADLFTTFEITSAQETTLGGNQWLKDSHRLHFHTNGTVEDFMYQDYNVVTDYETAAQGLWMNQNMLKNNIKRHTVIKALDDDSLNVSLFPGQIRTFIIQIKKY